jgi:hypothetical protein
MTGLSQKDILLIRFQFFKEPDPNAFSGKDKGHLFAAFPAFSDFCGLNARFQELS